jgi:hypothetical protein
VAGPRELEGKFSLMKQLRIFMHKKKEGEIALRKRFLSRIVTG